MARPATKPDWTKNNPNAGTERIEPTAQKKIAGFLAGERPTHEIMNWLFFNISEWIDHIDDTNQTAVTIRQTFDAIIGGAGATHSDINAVMADAALAAQDLRILVAGPLVFVQTQIINKDGVEIFGTPGGTIAKGGNTAIGIQIESNRVKIRDARFLNWNEDPGGVAIQLTATSKNCLIVDNSFHTVTTDIEDDGENNILANNLLEID